MTDDIREVSSDLDGASLIRPVESGIGILGREENLTKKGERGREKTGNPFESAATGCNLLPNPVA